MQESLVLRTPWSFRGMCENRYTWQSAVGNVWLSQDMTGKWHHWDGQKWNVTDLLSVGQPSQFLPNIDAKQFPGYPEASAPPIEEASKDLAAKVTGIQTKISDAMLEVDKEIRSGLFGKKGQVLSTEDIDKKFVHMFKKILNPLLGKGGGLGFDYEVAFDNIGRISVTFTKIGKTKNTPITFASSTSDRKVDAKGLEEGLGAAFTQMAAHSSDTLSAHNIDDDTLLSMGANLNTFLAEVSDIRNRYVRNASDLKDLQNNFKTQKAMISKEMRTQYFKNIGRDIKIFSASVLAFGVGIVGMIALATGAVVLPWYLAGVMGVASLAISGVAGLILTAVTFDGTWHSTSQYDKLQRDTALSTQRIESALGEMTPQISKTLSALSEKMPGHQAFLRETGYRNAMETLSDPARAKSISINVTYTVYNLLDNEDLICDKFNTIEDLKKAIGASPIKDHPLMKLVSENLKHVDLQFLQEYQFLKQQSSHKAVDAMRLNKLDYVSKHLNEFQDAFKEIKDTMAEKHQSTASSLSDHTFTFQISKESGVTVQDLLNRIDFEKQQEMGRNK